MDTHQIESWVLGIVERVEAHQPIEDFRVELKADWIAPDKAARRIAGHANAARGTPILWLIGVEEEQGVVGARHEDLASWWAEVQSCFDGLTPRLLDYNIPVKAKTVVALLFETERAPFVVKNPAYGQKEGGPVALEVPWREGTSTRTATRADLLSLLSPLRALPSFEVIAGTLTAETVGEELRLKWLLRLELYAETTEDLVAIPFHRCRALLEVPEVGFRAEFGDLHLRPPYTLSPETSSEPLSKTIEATRDEALIRGPGKLYLDASLLSPPVEFTPEVDAQVTAFLLPISAQHPVAVSATLRSSRPEKTEAFRWTTPGTA